MRKNTLILILFSSIFIYACSDNDNEINNNNDNNNYPENIFYGDILLQSQNEVNDFAISNYTKIIGSLSIGFDQQTTDQITSLSQLLSLKEIIGDLKINGTLLENLDGLNNIEYFQSITVSSSANLKTLSPLASNASNSITVNFIDLYGNSKLEEIDALSIINSFSITNFGTYLPQTIDIRSNSKLESIAGLSNIEGFGGGIRILYNEELLDITPLNGITELSVYTREGIWIEDNPKLQNADFSNLTSIPLFDPDLLSNSNLTHFSNSIYINNNPLLEDLNFSSLERVDTSIAITNNNMLTSINLPLLTSDNFFYEPSVQNMILAIKHNQSLLSINSQSIASIDYIYIYDNQNLETINFESLNYAGHFQLLNNTALNDISSLSSLSNIGGFNPNDPSNFEFGGYPNQPNISNYCSLSTLMSTLIFYNPNYNSHVIHNEPDNILTANDLSNNNCIVQ